MVRVARTREEFLAHLDAVVAAGPCPDGTAARVRRVTPEGWDARLGRVLELVRQRLDRGPAGSDAQPAWQPAEAGAEAPSAAP